MATSRRHSNAPDDVLTRSIAMFNGLRSPRIYVAPATTSGPIAIGLTTPGYRQITWTDWPQLRLMHVSRGLESLRSSRRPDADHHQAGRGGLGPENIRLRTWHHRLRPASIFSGSNNHRVHDYHGVPRQECSTNRGAMRPPTTRNRARRRRNIAWMQARSMSPVVRGARNRIVFSAILASTCRNRRCE